MVPTIGRVPRRKCRESGCENAGGGAETPDRRGYNAETTVTSKIRMEFGGTDVPWPVVP